MESAIFGSVASRKRQGVQARPVRGPWVGDMTDVLYVLVTLAAFVGLALLVGALDRSEKS